MSLSYAIENVIGEKITKIPKILHQIWIGDANLAPKKLMNTWKDKNPELEYIFWNEEEIEKRKLDLQPYIHRINEMEEMNGKADILRWIILQKYGGIFCDADSICIEPIDDFLISMPCFASLENEKVRGAGWSQNHEHSDIYAHKYPLIALGCIGFPPNHPLVNDALSWIKMNCVSVQKTSKRAWHTVGPGLITKLYFERYEKMPTQKYDLSILPSHYFLPKHYSGVNYTGHDKIYAYQEWGSTKQSYNSMNDIVLGEEFSEPKEWVSVLVSSYNTKIRYVKDAIKSIVDSQGHFGIELVWIDDGSDILMAKMLEKVIDHYRERTRFMKIIFEKNERNMGIGYTLNKGIQMCNHEIIIKMDSDDIMTLDRINKQFDYMKKNPDCGIVGGQLRMFLNDDLNHVVQNTSLSSMTWEQYKIKPSHWFVSHPTVCYRKSKVLECGNYNDSLSRMAEDFELEMRMMKLCGKVHNMSDILLLYRLHEGQVTHEGKKNDKWRLLREDMMRHHINSEGIEKYIVQEEFLDLIQ